MKKEIREIKDGVLRITTTGERWYAVTKPNEKGWDEYVFYPSMSWIADHYPKGVGFYKWLASKGWEDAESEKRLKGRRGSKVHQAIEMLSKGKEVRFDDKFVDPDSNEESDIDIEGWEALMSYKRWAEEVNPETIAAEFTLFDNYFFGDDEKFPGIAGTADWLGRIDGKLWLIDYKTSSRVWPSHKIQLVGYGQALQRDERFLAGLPTKVAEEITKGDINLGILQVGYSRNKRGYKMTPVEFSEHNIKLLSAAGTIWKDQVPKSSQHPSQKDYPISIKVIGAKTSQKKPKVSKKTNNKTKKK